MNKDLENARGQTALTVAVEAGQLSTMNTLLRRGARADYENASNRTALMLAIELGKFDAMLALLDRGANPNAENRCARSRTPVGGSKISPQLRGLPLWKRGDVKRIPLLDRSVHPWLRLTALYHQCKVIRNERNVVETQALACATSLVNHVSVFSGKVLTDAR